MLRYIQFTTLTKADPTRERQHSKTGWAIVVACIVAVSFLSESALGQDVEMVDPPTSVAETEQEKTTPAEGKDKTQKPAAPVKLKKLTVDLRGKELGFEAPENWKAKKPANNFTKHELILPKAEGDAKGARMTFSVVSGSNETNIGRWKTQFKFPNGAAPDKVFAMEKKTVDGYELTFVQIRGTFMESMGGGGPFAGGKKTPRENYMMKAIIISSPDADARTNKCFIKLVGSEKAIKQNAKAYAAMVKSMKSQAAVD